MKHTNVTVVLSFLVIILPIIVDSWYIYSFPSKLFHGHYNFVVWTTVTWERGSCRIQSNTEWFSQIPRKLMSHFSIGTSVIHFNSISYANNSYKNPLNFLVSLSNEIDQLHPWLICVEKRCQSARWILQPHINTHYGLGATDKWKELNETLNSVRTTNTKHSARLTSCAVNGKISA